MLFVVVVFPFLCNLQLLSQFLEVSLALFFYFLSSGTKLGWFVLYPNILPCGPKFSTESKETKIVYIVLEKDTSKPVYAYCSCTVGQVTDIVYDNLDHIWVISALNSEIA